MPQPQVPVAPPASKVFTVEVSLKNGGLHIAKEDMLVRMRLNDKIKWTAKDLEFWVVFEHQTPFERHALDASHAHDLRKPLLHGAFKYHIVLDSDRRIRIDPVVVVDPPPEDPSDRKGGG